MWRLLRTAIFWLVAIALPLQGLAAATMIHCGPGHHRMAAAPAAPAAQAASHDHATHDHSAGAHDAADAYPADQAAGVDEHGSASQWGQLAKFKCSACAACCSAAALPASLVTLPSVRHAAVFEAATSDSIAQFQTGGPERPPRIHLN